VSTKTASSAAVVVGSTAKRTARSPRPVIDSVAIEIVGATPELMTAPEYSCTFLTKTADE